MTQPDLKPHAIDARHVSPSTKQLDSTLLAIDLGTTTGWTMARVQDRLELAAEIMRQMPEVKPHGYFNTWPEYFHSFADQVGQEPQMRKPRPSPRMISEVDEAMLWLRWLEVEDAKLIWLRANGKPWKPICWQIGLSRTAATRRWKYGLAVIVWRLNGRSVPTRRSMDFVIGRAKARPLAR